MTRDNCPSDLTSELYRLLIDIPQRPDLEPLLQRVLELLRDLSGGTGAQLALGNSRTSVTLTAGAPGAHEISVPVRDLGALVLHADAPLGDEDLQRLELVIRVFAPYAADVLERAAIVRAIDAHQGNIAASARTLRMARSQIYKLMALYGIRRDLAQAA